MKDELKEFCDNIFYKGKHITENHVLCDGDELVSYIIEYHNDMYHLISVHEEWIFFKWISALR